MPRTRKFDLPEIHKLSKGQDAALALPPDGQHLIVGGPGTGKSIVALHRARRLSADGTNYRFLVYNKLLDQSNKHLFGVEHLFLAATWDTWFRKLWRTCFRDVIPTLQSRPGSTYRPIDWETVQRRIDELPRDHQKFRTSCHIVIDEGQDIPPALYNALVSLGFENFYVVADQNQQITETRSSRQDIENALAISTDETLELRDNYRNTHPVAALARHFYTDDPASPLPDLPPLGPSALTPELREYGGVNQPDLNGIAEQLLKMSDAKPRKLIGVITPNDSVRAGFVDALNKANPNLDSDKPRIQTYASGQQETLDFGIGSIMVINAQSCKGLEFDIAVLADIDRHRAVDTYSLKSRFYVMLTRAKDQVILLRTGRVNPQVEDLLPVDTAMLARN